jgi:hypothetical protein
MLAIAPRRWRMKTDKQHLTPAEDLRVSQQLFDIAYQMTHSQLQDLQQVMGEWQYFNHNIPQRSFWTDQTSYQNMQDAFKNTIVSIMTAENYQLTDHSYALDHLSDYHPQPVESHYIPMFSGGAALIALSIPFTAAAVYSKIDFFSSAAPAILSVIFLTGGVLLGIGLDERATPGLTEQHAITFQNTLHAYFAEHHIEAASSQAMQQSELWLERLLSYDEADLHSFLSKSEQDLGTV